MPRFRLPPPFNDPQDDVVFPPSSGGAGYRGLAPREERVRESDPDERRWLARGVKIAVFAAVVGTIGTFALMVFAPPSFGQLTQRVKPATPPVPDAPTPTSPILRPLEVAGRLNASQPDTSNTDARTHGTVSIATRPASTCTIAGLDLPTPIVRLALPEGAYSVSCVDPETGRSARFGVIVRAGSETRDVGHLLGEAPAESSRPLHAGHDTAPRP